MGVGLLYAPLRATGSVLTAGCASAKMRALAEVPTCPLAAPVLHTDIPGLERFRTGKVRDIYDVGDALLIVATDRISAFDYVLGSGIPDKGRVLTQLSAFWFEHLRDVVPNHVIALDPSHVPGGGARARRALRGRSDAGAHARRRCRSSASRGATCRARAGRTTRGPARLRHRAAARPARVGSPAGADLHAGDEGGDRPRRSTSRPPSAAALIGTRRCSALLRALTLALYARGGGARRIARHHPRRHQVRVRLDGRAGCRAT